jgi:hypothetical protein
VGRCRPMRNPDMSLRDRLKKLEMRGDERKAAEWPLLIECRRRGEMTCGEIETRASGVYGTELVFETEAEKERLLAPFVNPPAGVHPPLILSFGPEVVEPPPDLPRS